MNFDMTDVRFIMQQEHPPFSLPLRKVSVSHDFIMEDVAIPSYDDNRDCTIHITSFLLLLFRSNILKWCSLVPNHFICST